MESAKETADALHGIVEQYFEKEPAMSEVEKMARDLLDLRREVIDRMDVLTAYVDRFVVYEYVLNRIQYRFVIWKQCLRRCLCTGSVAIYFWKQG